MYRPEIHIADNRVRLLNHFSRQLRRAFKIIITAIVIVIAAKAKFLHLVLSMTQIGLT
tara:strand:- start:2272 stop:2445 length:174 start_codon:yes stop_codon:yes gene_type:complete